MKECARTQLEDEIHRGVRSVERVRAVACIYIYKKKLCSPSAAGQQHSDRLSVHVAYVVLLSLIGVSLASNIGARHLAVIILFLGISHEMCLDLFELFHICDL